MLPEQAAPPEAPSCGELQFKASVLLDRFGEVMADAERGRYGPDQGRRITYLTAAFREVRGQLARITFHEAQIQVAEARAEARGFERGRAAERAAVPARRGRHAPARSGAVLRLAPAVAAIGWLLRPLGKAARQVRAHGTAVKLTAAHLKLAAVVTASTATLAIGGAVVITYAGSPGSGPAGSSGTGAVPAASVYAAVPAPSSSPIALLVTRPKAKRSAESGAGLSGSGAQVPPWSPGPDPSAASAAPSASSAAGPAQLSLGGVTSLDLSNPLDPQATFTLSASGGGWVSWRISTTGTDLDFSPSSGVLKAGESVTVTVSVDPAQALDGSTSQVFGIDGQQVTVTLPPLVPAVSPTDVVPTGVLPSGVLPSGT